MKESAREFPLDIKISFKALFDKYRENADKGSAFQKKRAVTVSMAAGWLVVGFTWYTVKLVPSAIPCAVPVMVKLSASPLFWQPIRKRAERATIKYFIIYLSLLQK